MILDKFDLSGKTAIITGAGTGLGRAIALTLADARCDIVGAARRQEPLEESKRLVEAKGRRFLVVPTDITDSRQVNELIERAVSHFGRIDILINNAGLSGAGRGKTLPELTDEDWRIGIDVDLTGAFYCARAIVPHFLEHGGGRIINVSSAVGFRAFRNDFMYPVAKGGVIQLTKALAMTYARDGIRVNCIAPGLFPVRESQDGGSQRGERQPLGRAGRAEEIGALALFLCSDAAEYMSGETVLADGGVVAGGLLPAGVLPSAED